MFFQKKEKKENRKEPEFRDINKSVRQCNRFGWPRKIERGYFYMLAVVSSEELWSAGFLPGGYEPPLTNVFTMQWFLTLFATCLPNHTVLKIWDSVFFEGSEIILRVSLAIWAKLGE